MNRALVDRIAQALLYEGYLLYPYRPSVKNRQRWSFGGLYPPSYTAGRVGADAASMRTECLARGDSATRLAVSVRFLHLIERRVVELDRPAPAWPVAASEPIRFVEALRVGDDVVYSWQEAVEREITLDEASLGDLAAGARRVAFAFDSACDREPLRDPAGMIVGLVERRRRRVEGTVELSALELAEGVFRITAQIDNQTPFDVADSGDRDLVVLHAMVSTHTTLGLEGGEFISLLDPPEPLRELAAGCRNQGAWPVLVGDKGATDTMLSSPIILYDYPELAPESPGDLFDSTEIDEILTLRIMTLTEDEKRSMAALDDRGRALLERTEALARGQLMGLHGTMRDRRTSAGRVDS